MRALIRRNSANYSVQAAGLLLLACCLAIAAHAQAPYQVHSLVRFENAKTHQPLSEPVAVETLRVADDRKQAVAVQLSSAEELPLRLVLAFDISGSGRYSEGLEALRSSIPAFLQQIVRPGKDSVSLVDFNDEYYFDAGPTDDLHLVAERLKKYDEHRGGTAMFDAVVAISKSGYGKAGAMQERRVLLLVSDGQDNGSKSNLRSAITAAQASAVSVFAISTGENGSTRGNEILAFLANATGGRAFGRINSNQLGDFFNFLRSVLTSQFVMIYTLAEPPRKNIHRSVHITSTSADVLVFAPSGAMEH